MSTIFSKLWPGISLAIIAVLAFLLFRSCKTKPLPAADKSAALVASYDSTRRLDSTVIVDLTLQKDSLVDVADSLMARQTVMQFTLDTMGEHITGTMASLDVATIKHDTLKIILNCDSLEAQVKRGIPAVEGYTMLSDSLVKALVVSGTIQDSIIDKLTKDNKLASNVITAQQLDYSILNTDDKKKTAQLKIFKPVAIGGVAIVAGIILLKIIAH